MHPMACRPLNVSQARPLTRVCLPILVVDVGNSMQGVRTETTVVSYLDCVHQLVSIIFIVFRHKKHTPTRRVSTLAM